MNTRLLSFEFIFTVPLLLLSFITIVNLPVFVVLLFVQAYFVGAGVLDFSLEDKYNYRDSVIYIREHRGLSVGLGLGFVLLMLTVIGFLFAPAWSAAAGAYAFYQDIGSRTAEPVQD